MMNRQQKEYDGQGLNENHRLLTIGELSEWLGFTKNQIYAWTHLEKIPSIKIGKHLRFDREHIRLWLESKYNPLAKELCASNGTPNGTPREERWEP